MSEFALPFLSAEACVQAGDALTLIDVRKPAAVLASGLEVPGVERVDPFDLHLAHRCLETDTELVFFCVHGHEVSQYATAMAMVAGCRARYVLGGFEALVEAGMETVEMREKR